MAQKNDIDFVKSIIPPVYTVSESEEKKGSIHCVSTGTNKGMTDAQFDDFMSICDIYFDGRIQEYYHHVNADHQDFTIFLRTTPPEKTFEEKMTELFS